MSFEGEVDETQRYFSSARFEGITRLYSARQVVEQRGTIATDYTVARVAAEQFYARLRELFSQRRQITIVSPVQELLSWRCLGITRPVGHEVIAVNVHLVGAIADRQTIAQLLGNFRLPGRRQEGW